jgi:ABC-2 type transport system ATP-binding protein
MNTIEAAGLKKNYPIVKGYKELLFHPLRRKSVTALDGVDLNVKEKKCFCLLGPNGAGKTTLIKILSTLVLPDEGRAAVCGYDVEKESLQVKSVIGTALNEERSFYWRLTGRQNLEFFAALNGISKKRTLKKIDEVLALSGLSHAADNRFNTYSTGMKQMLALSRALLIDVKVLFVDEPTRSLDPKASQRMRCFLKEELVGSQGRTVFWATHDLNEARDFADEMAIIDKGLIKISGTVKKLTENGKKSLQTVFEDSVGDHGHTPGS